MNRLKQLISRNAADTGEIFEADCYSSNYSAGTAGWKIGLDGSVEFNDAVFRGEIVADTGEIGGFTIGATTLYAGTGEDYIEMTSDLPGKSGVGITLGAGGSGEYECGLTIHGIGSRINSGLSNNGGFGLDGTDVTSLTDDGRLTLYKDGTDASKRITLRSYDGSIVTYGPVTADIVNAVTKFQQNGTDGISDTIDLTTATSITVAGGIITGYA